MSRELIDYSPALAKEASAYRIPMKVVAVRRYPSNPELFTYPLCPRCDLPMDREYQNYCEHCGQALSWSQLNKAEVVLSYTLNEAR